MVELPEGINDTSQSLDQLGAGAAQFFSMDAGKTMQDFRACLG
jgi:hypothetical protein